MTDTIIEIDDVLISSEIITSKFSCDYEKCQGVCCIIGDSGAPLSQEECDFLSNNSEILNSIVSKEGLCSIREQGPFILDSDGDLVTPLINNEECAYTKFDDSENCMCAIEIANKNGRISFKKPISCWLYPIRVTRLSNGGRAMNLHKWHICNDAFKKGEREDISVYKFLKEPLICEFGEEFYRKLEIVAEARLTNPIP